MSFELLDFDNILSDIEVESDINLTTEHLDEVGNSLQLDDDVLINFLQENEVKNSVKKQGVT